LLTKLFKHILLSQINQNVIMPCVLRQKTTTTEVKMSKIGLFVGSTTGETEEAAETTQE